jgi:hypothetical protein
VSEQECLWGCKTTHSKASVALMSGKIEVLWSDLRKLQNYTISGNQCWALTCKNLFCCTVWTYMFIVGHGRVKSLFVSVHCFHSVNVDNIWMWTCEVSVVKTVKKVFTDMEDIITPQEENSIFMKYVKLITHTLSTDVSLISKAALVCCSEKQQHCCLNRHELNSCLYMKSFKLYTLQSK